jgi:hypothetical protein
MFFLFLIAVEAKEEDQVDCDWYCFSLVSFEILVMFLGFTSNLTKSFVLIYVQFGVYFGTSGLYSCVCML